MVISITTSAKSTLMFRGYNFVKTIIAIILTFYGYENNLFMFTECIKGYKSRNMQTFHILKSHGWKAFEPQHLKTFEFLSGQF